MRHVSKRRDRSRMPANLSKPIEHSIAAYALAASAAGVATLALVTPAEAAPVCKNLSAALNYTATFAFNPAHQSIAPFNVAQSYHTFSTLTSTGINRGFFTPNLRGAEAVVSSKGFIADLASGASIGSGARFGKGAGYGLIFTYTPSQGVSSRRHFGNLRFGQTNYFGFKFLISGQPHYGWVRLESTIVKGGRTPSIDTKIMAYGYESSPNTAILAGSCAAASRENAAGSTPSNQRVKADEMTANNAPAASLGTLALGAQGLPLWRK
jgi:hypothetical protein